MPPAAAPLAGRRLLPAWTTGWTPGVALAGLALVLLGAWTFAVAVVGVKFAFSFDGQPAWDWSRQHWELSLAPGLAAVAGGLLMASRSVGLARLGALAGLAAGAWLCVGPFAYPVWTAGLSRIGPQASTDGKRALLWIGWYVGTGALTAAVAGHGLGLLARRHLSAPAAGAGPVGGVPVRMAPDGTLYRDDLARPAAAPLGAPVSERRAPTPAGPAAPVPAAPVPPAAPATPAAPERAPAEHLP